MKSRRAVIASLAGCVLFLGCDSAPPADNSAVNSDAGTIGNPKPNHLISETSNNPPGTVDMTPPTAADADAAKQLALIMRGMNIGNYMDQPGKPNDSTKTQCPASGPPMEGAGAGGGRLAGWMFEAIHQAGFDHVRLTINWNCHTHVTDSNPYAIDQDWFDRIDWAIAHVLTRQMAIVIDMHNFWDYFNGLSGQSEKLGSLWTQIADHYKNYPKQLYFEVLNEPPWGFSETTWGTDLAACIAAIRATNPNRTIIYGGTDYNKAYTLTRLTSYLPANDKNLIATEHYYSPYCFTHGQPSDCSAYYGTAYDATKPNVQWPVMYPGDFAGDAGDAAAQKSLDTVKTDFDTIAASGQQIGQPIYVGEFGAPQSRDMVSRAAYIAAVARASEQHGMGWANWGFVNTTFDAWNGTTGWYPPIITALLPNYVETSN